MTHPSIPLESTPTFAGMLNDPRYAELARDLAEGSSGSSHSTYLPRHTGLDKCPACQPISLSFLITNPTPPRDDRHLAICAAPVTDPSRLEPVRNPGRRSRTKKTAASHLSTKASH